MLKFPTTLLCIQDYLIAQGVGKLMPGQSPHTALKNSFSQDGVKWIDLEALSQETASKAANLSGMLSGEPAKAYTVQAPGAAPVAESEVTNTMLCAINAEHLCTLACYSM